ncbi:GH1 family beta-glucosidase [Nonomuraea diastatica]|uniref:GH1 family beta-glucosidase n=1 Tax=Nonomuraea diastatica TaxID=1848329 RepID=UPI00140D2690|nr:GH1 family beta-glucosidase [Nonomuraea diastatica]
MSFPAGFLWGAGTSAYQIEGHHGRGESVWDTFCRRPGAVEGGGDGSRACDSYLRWREDVELVEELGLRAYRFSTGWSRVMPDGVPPDPQALDHYERFVDALLEAGAEPVLTLNHWDMPAALTGGWAERASVAAFAAYTEAVAGRLADRVTWWITQNEPWIIALLGYQLGLHAPGVADLGTAVKAGHHVLLGHGAAADVLHAHPGVLAGSALSLFPCDPATAGEADRAAATGSDGYVNRWYLDPLLAGGYPADMRGHWERALGHGLDFIQDGDEAAIRGRSDFLGVNYYTRRVMAAAPPDPFPWRVVGPSGDVARTDEGWEINAGALRDLLIGLSRRFPATPLMVTENGGVFGDTPAHDGRVHDNRRILFLRDHVAAVGEAIDAGADVRGYLHWSLMDNFEWALGYRPRFGLVHVDYATGARTIKDSGRYYARLIAGGGAAPALPRIEAYG